jgi:hypothetical protein
MDIKDFFDFSSKYVSSTFQAAAIGLRIDKDVDEHWNLIKGEYTGINFPVIFKQEEGKKLTDILDTGWAGFFLISNRLKILLEGNGLTGWKTYPIRLYDKKENEISDYHGFSVIGRCGPINYENAEIIEKRRVPTGPICKFYKGLYIGLDQWDGTDFFVPDRTYGTIITKRAATVLNKNKITNVRLENLADIETSVGNDRRHI